MGLSGLQFLGIAGGRAADIVKADDIRRSKEYNTAFNKFIDNNVGALKTASSKQKLILNKAKKDISQIVSTYLGGREDLSDSVKYEIANTIYASHGYNMKDVKSDAANRLQQYVNSGNDANNFNYVNEYITNAKDITSERTLDQIASKHAQEISPMPNLDLAAKAVGLGKYKETTFVSPDTDRIEKDLISATGYKPDTAIPEGPTIGIAGPVVDVKSKLDVDKIKQSMLANAAKAEKMQLEKEKLLETLQKGEFDTNQINKLYDFQLGLAYNAQGLKVGSDDDGILKPDEFGPRTHKAQKDSFEYLVTRIIGAKNPVRGEAYIFTKAVRNDLAAIGKNIPRAAIIGQKDKNDVAFKMKDRVVGRKYQNEVNGKEYIYLGLTIPDLILG